MKTEPTMIQVLLKRAQKGPIRARDLDQLGIPRTYLHRLCDRGMLQKIDRGFYRLPSAEVSELHSLVQVAIRVPHATICLLSALQFHGLTTELPHAVWIMINRHARMPKINYPKLEVVRASGNAREYGVSTQAIEGQNVSMTTPAKTVADCFRYRQHVGLDVAMEAMRDYFRNDRSGTNAVSALVEAARADRVYTVMLPYMEALA